jgi:hypothetical protein
VSVATPTRGCLFQETEGSRPLWKRPLRYGKWCQNPAVRVAPSKKLKREGRKGKNERGRTPRREGDGKEVSGKPTNQQANFENKRRKKERGREGEKGRKGKEKNKQKPRHPGGCAMAGMCDGGRCDGGETYHHPLELAVARELPASRYVSVIEGLSLFNVRVDVVRSGQPGYQSRI